MHTICCFEAREVSNPMLQTYAIRSWNEGVRAIGSRLHQGEGQFRGLRNQPLAAKSQEDGCEISLWLRNGVLHVAKFHSHLARLRNSPEASRYLRLTFFRFFALDIWCLNPHSFLVIHLSYESLVFKQEKRVNSLLYNVCNFHYRERSGGLFSQTTFV